MLKKILLAASLFALFALAGRALAEDTDNRDGNDSKWVATWATSPATSSRAPSRP